MRSFTDEEDLALYIEELHKKLETSGNLSGEDAALFIAALHSNATHGNYDAETLFSRTDLDQHYVISISKKT